MNKSSFNDRHICCILVDIVKCPCNVLFDSTTVISCIFNKQPTAKLSKYAELASDYIFQPIAVENLGSFDSSTSELYI